MRSTTINAPGRASMLSDRVDALSARVTPLGLAVVRVTLGLVWLQNTGWKTPPDFGKSTNSGLYFYTHTAIDHPVLDPFAFIVRKLILPNWTIYGWVTLLAEATIGALMIIGLWTRTTALVGFLATIPITLSVLHLKGEWPWSYYLMLIAHLAVAMSTAGRGFGLDGIRRRTGTDAWRSGAAALSALAIGTGFMGLLRAPSTSFTATRGTPIGPRSGYELSLMVFNRAGALLVLLLGVVGLAAVLTRQRLLLHVAAAGFVAYSVQVLTQFRPHGGGVLGGNGATLSFVIAMAAGFAVLAPSRRRAGTTR